ncbi:ankyrin, partial [Aspergillus sclerotiicarbonarius CBS 121057]
ALEKSAYWGCEDAVKLLLKVPAVNPNGADAGGATALHRAAENGHTSIIQALLSSGANPSAMDQEGRRPLHLAAGNGNVEAISALCEA